MSPLRVARCEPVRCALKILASVSDRVGPDAGATIGGITSPCRGHVHRSRLSGAVVAADEEHVVGGRDRQRHLEEFRHPYRRPRSTLAERDAAGLPAPVSATSPVTSSTQRSDGFSLFRCHSQHPRPPKRSFARSTAAGPGRLSVPSPTVAELDFVDRERRVVQRPRCGGGLRGRVDVPHPRRRRHLELGDDDGGASGDLHARGALPFGCDKDVTFTSVTVGWASTACAAGVPHLYAGDDGGSRWLQLPHVPVPAGVSTSGGWDMAPPLVVGNLVAVAHDARRRARCVSRGDESRRRTEPGARGWSRALRQLAIVDVVDPTHWIGTDGTVLVATDDGGSHWNRWKPAVAMKDAQGTPLTLDFLSPTLGCPVPRDAGGPLWWTTEGGKTWAPVTITISS